MAYRLAVGREPTTRETERAEAYLNDAEAEFRAEAKRNPGTPIPKKKGPNPDAKANDVDRGPFAAVEPRVAAWATLSQAIFASAEFRYVR